ncbi:MAG: putative sugar O-methyltransferase [Candidatus Pacebacteria bacterium]|nr:putative sugar O-methyltransferase [Candidatus Paceibacterota bacterium]
MVSYQKIIRTINEGGVTLLFKKIWRKLRPSYIDHLAHQTPHGLPKTHLEIKKMAIDVEDIALAERIIKAFHKASLDEKQHFNRKIADSEIDAWDDNKMKYHKDLYLILTSNDTQKTAEYLCNMHLQSATYGISGSATEYGEMISSGRLRDQKGALTKDALVSFAEALGILPYEAIVPYVIKNNIYVDADTLINKIEKEIGIKIAPPEIDGGLYKLKLKMGSFDPRDFYSLYAAWRINHILGKNTPICEIGAGIGKVALYASRFGFLNYSIFDLPLINAIQAWYLIKSLPGGRITLYGEKNNTEDSIKILPYWEFMRTNNRYALVLNQDSFPEISKEIVEGYLNKIEECTTYFLSINQEHEAPLFDGAEKRNLIVPDMTKKYRKLKKIYRFPFWLRKGYVEELYQVQIP